MADAEKDIYLDLAATLSANMVPCDYGVSGSPTWLQAEDVEVLSVTISNKSYSQKELVETFGEQGAKALTAIILDASSEEGWDNAEVYEPEPPEREDYEPFAAE